MTTLTIEEGFEKKLCKLAWDRVDTNNSSPDTAILFDRGLNIAQAVGNGENGAFSHSLR